MLAKVSEYEDENNRLKQNQADDIELRNILFNIDGKTQMIDERTREMSDKEDKILATVSESSEKIDEILSKMQSLRTAIEELAEFSDEQLDGIKSIFEALRSNEFEKGIADQIDAVLAEVKNGNTRNLVDKLILFLGTAGSVASITGQSISDIRWEMLQAPIQALLKYFGLV